VVAVRGAGVVDRGRDAVRRRDRGETPKDALPSWLDDRDIIGSPAELRSAATSSPDAHHAGRYAGLDRPE
jgi:hypothetical protein